MKYLRERSESKIQKISISIIFSTFATEMRHATNILTTSIMLALMLLGASGVSVEKCSCTGRVSLTIPTDRGCCSDENNCMTVKTIQLSDYMPTMTAHVDMPVQPCLFTLFSPSTPMLQTVATWQQGALCADAPPGGLATTVTVLRV